MNLMPPTPADVLGDVADALIALASALRRLHDAFSAPPTVAASTVEPFTLPKAARPPSDQKREKVRGSQRDRWLPERMERAIEVIIDVTGTSTLGEAAILAAVGGNRALTRDALRLAVARGLIGREGLGKPRHPYRYRVARKFALCDHALAPTNLEPGEAG